MSALTENNLYNLRVPYDDGMPGTKFVVQEPEVGKWYQGYEIVGADATHTAGQIARYDGNGHWWPEGAGDMYQFDYLRCMGVDMRNAGPGSGADLARAFERTAQEQMIEFKTSHALPEIASAQLQHYEKIVGKLPKQEFSLQPGDIIISTYHAPGTNRGFFLASQNGVHLYHKPTGLEVREHAERSVHKNKAVALQKLTELVARLGSTPARPPVATTSSKHPRTLKELRMWHWRQVTRLRGEQRFYEVQEDPALAARAKRFGEMANLHLSAVQVLNDSVPGTAEQDCAEADRST